MYDKAVTTEGLGEDPNTGVKAGGRINPNKSGWVDQKMAGKEHREQDSTDQLGASKDKTLQTRTGGQDTGETHHGNKDQESLTEQNRT